MFRRLEHASSSIFNRQVAILAWEEAIGRVAAESGTSSDMQPDPLICRLALLELSAEATLLASDNGHYVHMVPDLPVLAVFHEAMHNVVTRDR